MLLRVVFLFRGLGLVLSLVLGLVLAGGAAYASGPAAGPVPPPSDLCLGTGCTLRMQAIFNQFEHTPAAPDARVFPAVFSGECFYLGFDTDPGVTQYGVTLLDRKGSDKPWFMALFGFFQPENPFKNLSVAAARDLLAREGSSGASLSFGKDYAYAEFPGDSPATRIRYWMRQDPRSERLLLLSRWVFADPAGMQEIFCELAPNHFSPGIASLSAESLTEAETHLRPHERTR